MEYGVSSISVSRQPRPRELSPPAYPLWITQPRTLSHNSPCAQAQLVSTQVAKGIPVARCTLFSAHPFRLVSFSGRCTLVARTLAHSTQIRSNQKSPTGIAAFVRMPHRTPCPCPPCPRFCSPAQLCSNLAGRCQSPACSSEEQVKAVMHRQLKESRAL